MCMFPSLFGADHLKMIRGQHCELEGRIVLCNSSGNSKKTFMFEKRSASVLNFKPCRFAATHSSIFTANQFEQTKLQPHGSFALALCGQVRVISLHRDWPQGIYNIQSILPGDQRHSEVYLRKKTLLDPSKNRTGAFKNGLDNRKNIIGDPNPYNGFGRRCFLFWGGCGIVVGACHPWPV